MNRTSESKPWFFRDDGHPEARDYDDNYVAVEPQAPRGAWLMPCIRREPMLPHALRIVPAVAD
jgi:hypothetical protein